MVYEENGIQDVFNLQELRDLLEMGETYKPSTKIKKRLPIKMLLGEVNLSEEEFIENLKKSGIQDALKMKIELLNFLRKEEIIASSIQKFELQKRIENLEREIMDMKRK